MYIHWGRIRCGFSSVGPQKKIYTNGCSFWRGFIVKCKIQNKYVTIDADFILQDCSGKPAPDPTPLNIIFVLMILDQTCISVCLPENVTNSYLLGAVHAALFPPLHGIRRDTATKGSTDTVAEPLRSHKETIEPM